MRGVIDSTDIPLNVSRSALQTDRTVRKIADYIPGKWRSPKNSTAIAAKNTLVFGKMSPLSNSALSTTKFKNKSKISLSIAPPMRQDRQKCPETPAVQVQSQEETLGKM